MELTNDTLMELKYEARHGDEWAQMCLDDYYDQFDEIPEPMTFEEAIEYKKESVALDMVYWIITFDDDYYGEDGRDNYPKYNF